MDVLDNGEYGIGGGPGWLHGGNVTVTNSRVGIDYTVGHVRADGLVVQGNALYGIFTPLVQLTDSTVTGNGIDLSTVRFPRLSNTTCDTSEARETESREPVLGPWGVCALD